MSDVIVIDKNVIVLPTADLTYKSGLKIVINKCVGVCTPSTLFAIPVQVIAARITGRANQTSNDGAAAAVHETLSKPGQTMAGLESELLALAQGHDNAVHRFSELKAYKLGGWGPFRQLKLWKHGQAMPMSFVPRGKGEMKRFDAFFTQAVPPASA